MPTPSPNPTPAPLVESEFDLRVEAPELQWAAEPVQVAATLTYTGPLAAITVWASHAGLAQFYLESISDGLSMSTETDDWPIRYTLTRDQPVSLPITKAANWSTGDGHVEFYESWLNDPELHLPVGAWDVNAILWLTSRCPGCSGANEDLPLHIIRSTLVRMTPQPPLAMPAEGCADDFHAPYSQFPEQLVVGTDTQARLTMFSGWWWRDGNGGGDVDYGMYEVDLPARPIQVPAGGSIPVKVEQGFQLIWAGATRFAAESFSVAGGALLETGRTLGHPRVSYPEDGGFRVWMPDVAGKWVIRVDVVWLTPCLGGDGEIHFAVDTR